MTMRGLPKQCRQRKHLTSLLSSLVIMSRRREKPGRRIFAFGHGLSYTQFAYVNLKVTPDKTGREGQSTVSVDVTNKGKIAGDEIVQMYVHDDVGSVTRPVKELKGFARISLKPGETKNVQFPITPDKLSFLNEDMQRVVSR